MNGNKSSDCCSRCPLRAAREGSLSPAAARVVKELFASGCPAWFDGVTDSGQVISRAPSPDAPPGSDTMVRGCVFQLTMETSAAVVSASNRPAAELGALRVEMGRDLAGIRASVEQMGVALGALLTAASPVKGARSIASRVRGLLGRP